MGDPSTIGDYEIVGRLARGGMGTLYLGRRAGAAGFARHVAIKVLHEHLSHDEVLARTFVEEAKLSARIVDPGVVHVEEFGLADGGHYLVMELVHGCSLAELQRELTAQGRRMGPAFAAYVAMKVADALHSAHETADDDGRQLEIVHRDVSPQNVLLAYAGHVKLIDFGIARTRHHAAKTGVVDLKGKLSYMAPEQVTAKRLDRRTDVYALGIVLWEMLAARRLFAGENDFATLDLVRRGDVAPPSRYHEDVAPALDEVVLAALARDPGRRPATARELKRRLGRACPEALHVDAEDLRELLGAVMARFDRKRYAELPHPVTTALTADGVLRSVDDPTPAQRQVLRTLTVDLDPAGPAERLAEPPTLTLRSPSRRRSLIPYAAAGAAIVAGAVLFAALIQPTNAPGSPVTIVDVSQPELEPGSDSFSNPALGECRVGDPSYNRCVIGALEGRAQSANDLVMLIETYRNLGNQGAAMRHMVTFVRRYPTHGRAQGYQQILAARGVSYGPAPARQ